MTATIFVDGAAGTTGLEILDRLAGRDEFELLVLDEASRKSAEARRDAFHAADFAILCLPDEAAREAVTLAEGAKARIIDASSAHRVAQAGSTAFRRSAAAMPSPARRGSAIPAATRPGSSRCSRRWCGSACCRPTGPTPATPSPAIRAAAKR